MGGKRGGGGGGGGGGVVGRAHFDVLEDETCCEYQAWEKRRTSPNVVADLSVHLIRLFAPCPTFERLQPS